MQAEHGDHLEEPADADRRFERISHQENPAERLEAIERGLAARPDRHTRGWLLVHKAIAISEGGDAAGGLVMLRQLASDAGGSLGTRAVAELALARMSSKTSP